MGDGEETGADSNQLEAMDQSRLDSDFWVRERNKPHAVAEWHFTTNDVRIKT